MSSPMPTPASTPKKSLRQRMGTAVRRNSSFLLPSRPGTPTARAHVEDPFAAAVPHSPPKSATHSPPKSATLSSSKTASVLSVENPAAAPTPAPEPPAAQEKQPAEADTPAPPAEAVPAAPEPAPEAPAEPVAQDGPPLEKSKSLRSRMTSVVRRSSSFVRPSRSVTPVRRRDSSDTHTPAPSVHAPEPPAEPAPYEAPPAEEPQPAPEPEAPAPPEAGAPSEPPYHEEQQSERAITAEPAHEAPIHDSPRSMSRTASRESFAHSEHAPSADSMHMHMTESPRALSVKTSHENLLQELSPILEDERSAVEDRSLHVAFAVPSGAPPSRLAVPAADPVPGLGPSFSNSSDRTTPRAHPPPFAPAQAPLQPPFAGEKGKEREQNGSAAPMPMPEGLPYDGYFAASSPMPIPARPDAHYYTEDPFRDPDPLPVSTVPYDGMPVPETRAPEPLEQRAAVTVDPLHQPVAFPLPSLDDVTTRNLRNVPSDYTLAAHSSKAPSVSQELETE
ncbi:hypothetical protein DFH11DRAFT_1238771 [Phellopilus nigrolimitatus]|nr:hypothetical protein DFH11DRAFT_1238771 [Phellopilus nigrolimitatus]